MSDWKNVQYKDGKMRTSEGGGTVTDVEVDGQSVVNAQGVAEITMPSVPSDLDDLSDVDLTGLSDGNILAYQQSSGKFKPTSAPSGGGNVDDVEVNGTSVVGQNKVAKIVSYKEVTQSQYNALPASKESDGILYCISDAPGGVEGFPPLIYSLEEREVGVWTDGKPLYQKTIEWQDTSVKTYIRKDIHELNIDTLVYAEGMFTRINNGHLYWYPFSTTESTSEYGFFRVDDENGYANGQILWRINYNATTKQRFTFWYTKTTDTAGSGQWSTDGTPTHHYSTSEKVVGTWIDGKPIYEKVITGLSITMNWNAQYRTENTFANAPNDVDTLVSIDGYGMLGNNKVHYGITAYGYGSSNWVLSSLETGTINTLIIQYTKTTD